MHQDTHRAPAASAPDQGQLPLFAPAARTTLTYRRDDGGPLTDDDFARLHALARGGAR
ncbi:hypothetical protein [Streptomyces sp. NPDC058861]|uniref:hypothetical protein n=1 Tax=Streptomyces sp. NPDC058861 TaxID=3346653 RepID=UPI0036AE207B